MHETQLFLSMLWIAYQIGLSIPGMPDADLEGELLDR